jgi:hypothetical protein
MARALPLSRAHAVLALALACACNSDEPLDTTTGIDLTTGDVMTMEFPFTTMPPSDETTGEPEIPDQTCRMALNCVVGCFIETSNPGEEEDLSCYRECLDGMTTEEYLALFRLAVCVSDDCFARMICSEDGENDDAQCQECIVNQGLLGLNPQSTACDVEFMACN